MSYGYHTKEDRQLDKVIVRTDHQSDDEYLDTDNWVFLSDVGLICAAYIPIPKDQYTLKMREGTVYCVPNDSMYDADYIGLWYRLNYEHTDTRYHLVYGTLYRHKYTDRVEVQTVMRVRLLSDDPEDKIVYEHRVRLDINTDHITVQQIDRVLVEYKEKVDNPRGNNVNRLSSMIIEDAVKSDVYSVTLTIRERGYHIYEYLEHIAAGLQSHISPGDEWMKDPTALREYRP